MAAHFISNGPNPKYITYLTLVFSALLGLALGIFIFWMMSYVDTLPAMNP